ncbi:hypothetical protein [Wielerella bovis]|nr:hypothetical protein [Wielerella bovis]ULJ64557.1 hypothetical protein MIS33_10565 [Wielerella bovis]ULJ66846.1 hypothetical protein MIS31_11540 [Wielerella bovis]
MADIWDKFQAALQYTTKIVGLPEACPLPRWRQGRGQIGGNPKNCRVP